MNTESDFLRLLRTASEQDLAVMAKLLSPYLAAEGLRQVQIWGDKNRVHLENATVPLNDLLLNTRSGHITIEADCFFCHRCMLLTGSHDYKETGLSRLKKVPDTGNDIHIKEGVWLGSGVTVLGPCVIGENSVVAAGSLVTKDIPAGVIAYGSPAKPIKYIDGTEYR